jgi:linearmycin/streptolysin S transport system permease protein
MNFRTAIVIFWTIVRKEILSTYTNRNFVLLILVTPVVLALVLGAASSGLSSANPPSLNTPIAIVNQDGGNGSTNFGQLFETVLIPAAAKQNPLTAQNIACNPNAAGGASNALPAIEAVKIDDADTARRSVEDGKFAAAIVVPPDFSRKVGYTLTHRTVEPTEVEVYANSGNPLAASLVRSIAESITIQIVTGNIAVAATFEALEQHFGAQGALAALDSAFMARLACAFDPSFGSIQLEHQYIADTKTGFDFFSYIASGQAMFFLLFVALRGVTDILNEKRQGTFQRLIVAPIPRYMILVGKLGGTFVNCLLQLVVLYIALSVVRLVLKNDFQPIWGVDVIRIGLVMLAATFAASGLGMLVMAAARNPQQADALTGLLTTLMAALGGAFFPVQSVPVVNLVAKLSLTYWGSDALYRLAAGQGDVGLDLLMLIVLGGIMFGLGVWLFARRQEV